VGRERGVGGEASGQGYLPDAGLHYAPKRTWARQSIKSPVGTLNGSSSKRNERPRRKGLQGGRKGARENLLYRMALMSTPR